MTTNEKISNAQKMITGFLTLILGRKTKVVWGRNASCDSSKTVYLPRPKVGDAAECALMTRRALHEAGHCELTDFEAIKDLDPSVHVLMNALEDIRMEHQQSGMYRGASLILSRGLPELFIQYQQRLDVASPEDGSKLIALNVLVKAARKLLTKHAYGSAVDELVDKGDQLLGPEGRQAVDVATTNLAQCANTADVVKIAKELWVALQSIKPENPDQSSKNSADQQKEGEKSGEPEKGAPDAQKSSDKPSGDANSKSQSSEGSHSEPDGPSLQVGEPAGDNSPQTSSDLEQGQSTGGSTESTEADASTAGAGEDGEGTTTKGESVNTETPPDSNPGQQEQPNGTGTPTQGGASGEDDPAGACSPNDDVSGQEEVTNTHNPELASKNDQNSGSETKKFSGTPKGQMPGKFDLSLARDFDVGSLLKDAYEAQFGSQDVDESLAPDKEQAQALTEKELETLARAMEQAISDGEPLEAALEAFANVPNPSQSDNHEADSESNSKSSTGGDGSCIGVKQQIPRDYQLGGIASRLVRVFTKELQDKRRRPVKQMPAGGQIAPHRVWRLKRLGDTKIFNGHARVCGVDAAVTILLDRSLSMEEDIVKACTVALACSQAFERISRVKVSIELFPGQEDGIWTETLQPFGLSARQIARKVDDVQAGGGTPLAEAIVEILPRLLAQRVEKRIVLLITDGNPNNKFAALREIDELQLLGIGLIGIGIGKQGEAIHDLTPHSVTISQVSELPDALEALFRSNVASMVA